MNTLTAIPQTVTRRDFVLGVILSNDFRMRDDGYLYPKVATILTPLVRVLVGGSSYAVERRRTADSPWMQIQSMSLNDFDQAAFENWADMWPLSA